MKKIIVKRKNIYRDEYEYYSVDEFKNEFLHIIGFYEEIEEYSREALLRYLEELEEEDPDYIIDFIEKDYNLEELACLLPNKRHIVDIMYFNDSIEVQLIEE